MSLSHVSSMHHGSTNQVINKPERQTARISNVLSALTGYIFVLVYGYYESHFSKGLVNWLLNNIVQATLIQILQLTSHTKLSGHRWSYLIFDILITLR